MDLKKTTKRFAFVISDFYGGGAQKVLLNTAEELRSRGHMVRVYTLRERIEHEIPKELEIINLAVINKATKALSNTFIEKLQAKYIKKALLEFKPEVVISCSCDKITRHISGFNMYFWIHGNSFAATEESKQKKVIAKQKKIYLGKKLIVVSEGIRESLTQGIGLDNKDIQVIYNPFDQDLIIQKSKQYIKPPFPEYFIHVGTFEIRKRHDRLLEAYHLSKSKTPLVLMGKGNSEDEKRITKKIKYLNLHDRVTIIPFQANPYPYIAKSKALILTSDQEGLPTVLIEALLLHTPIISVDCPSGPNEILTGSLAKFLVPMEDTNALADAIHNMDDSPIAVEPQYYKKFLSSSVIPKFERL